MKEHEGNEEEKSKNKYALRPLPARRPLKDTNSRQRLSGKGAGRSFDCQWRDLSMENVLYNGKLSNHSLCLQLSYGFL